MPAYPSQVAADLDSSVDSALAELGLPTWIIDRDGVVRWTNEEAVDLFGEGQGRHYSLFVARECIDHVRGDFAKMILGSARTSESEAVLRHRDGGRIAVEAHNIALADEQRVVGGVRAGAATA
jgi:PAS domain S-box-containing protein